jgi:flagellar biosynthesis protein FlhB
MELMLGFCISAFIAVVAIDTLQYRRQHMKDFRMDRHERN